MSEAHPHQQTKPLYVPFHFIFVPFTFHFALSSSLFKNLHTVRVFSAFILRRISVLRTYYVNGTGTFFGRYIYCSLDPLECLIALYQQCSSSNRSSTFLAFSQCIKVFFATQKWRTHVTTHLFHEFICNHTNFSCFLAGSGRICINTIMYNYA